MRFDGMSAAEVYEREIVTGILGEWTPALVELAAPRAGERVLDLACGSGGVTRQVAVVLAATGSIVAVDFSAPMLEVARTRGVPGGTTVEWREASADDLPIADADVDVILCQQGLQFFPDKPAAAAEMFRVLRPGGRVALSVWRGLEANPLQQALNDSLLVHAGAAIFTSPFSYGDSATLERLLRDAGFADVAVEEQTRTAVADSTEHFAAAHIAGAAAVIPELAALGAEDRERISVAASREVTPVAEPYRKNGRLEFPMASLVATARKPDA